MVPEASSAGESQSNGKAENAVKRLEGQVRTFKSALETNIGTRIPNTHPVFAWMVEHAAGVLNRHLHNEDGETPYQSIHGQRFRGRSAEFGEKVFYDVPKRLRSKMNLAWRWGTYLGNAQASNDVYVGAKNGDVVKSRSIVRVVMASRWNSRDVLGLRGSPHCFRPSGASDPCSQIEEQATPHVNADHPDAAGPHGDSEMPVPPDSSY